MSPKHLCNALNEMFQTDNNKCLKSHDDDHREIDELQCQMVDHIAMKSIKNKKLPITISTSSRNNKNLTDNIVLNNVKKSSMTMIHNNLRFTCDQEQQQDEEKQIVQNNCNKYVRHDQQQQQQQQQKVRQHQRLLESIVGIVCTNKYKGADNYTDDYDNRNDRVDTASVTNLKEIEDRKSSRTDMCVTLTGSFRSSCSFEPKNKHYSTSKESSTNRINIKQLKTKCLTNNIQRELTRQKIVSFLVPKHDVATITTSTIITTNATSDERNQQNAIAKTTNIIMPTTTTLKSAITNVGSALSTLTTTTTTTTITGAVSYENKYVSNSWCQLSNQKCLEVNVSLLTLTALDQCKKKESNISSCNNRKILAKKKALLKQEFFQDITSNTTKANALTQKHILAQAKSDLQVQITNTAGCISDISSCSGESLVAQRTRYLKEKLIKSNYKVKDNINSNASNLVFSKEFPQIKELVQKFDSKVAVLTRKMLLPPKASKNDILQEMDASKAKENLLQQQEQQQQRHQQSPLSDEGCNLEQSPYSTDDDEIIAEDDNNAPVRTIKKVIDSNKMARMRKNPLKEKVSRSGSRDSALGLEIEEATDAFPSSVSTPPPQNERQQKRRMTLTVTDIPLRPALLPLAEPTLLPDSPTLEAPPPSTSSTDTIITTAASIKPLVGPSAPPSKILLEERVISIPEDPRHIRTANNSRRESCFSDCTTKDSEMSGVRYVRTPSVVISDYSDDVMCGITLEEIEYFRAQRMRHRRSSLDTSNTMEKDNSNSDVSNASSCSNLYYCGSTISALDGSECLVNGERLELQRKVSDCSSMASLSGEDEDGDTIIHSIPEQIETDMVHLADKFSNQHFNNMSRSKKVGDNGDPNFT